MLWELHFVFSSAKLNATALLRVNELVDFNFIINYWTGRVNTDAHTLSCILSFESYIDTCTENILPKLQILYRAVTTIFILGGAGP